ncbi:MAG TPA: diguanylate cyclase [Azospirillaceae bacterium]|nr:diguanylate cyclase [Azospirillaceae bacterium]
MARLRADGVPPNPNNFMVWYGYHTGRIPDLNRSIDILVSNNQPITEERCADLYRQFFAPDSDGAAIREAGERLNAALEQALTAITQGGADVGQYGQALDAFGGTIGLADTIEQLKQVVRSVAEETQTMAVKNRHLQSQLTDSSSQLEAMRKDLDSVKREAMTDALTGIANRKLFDQALRDAAMESMEADQPLCLMLVDIDHFKKFNDTHGHVVGDQVLKLVARTLTECVKGRDTAARYGGEEFAIIMPDTRLDNAVKVAEQIRKAVAGRRIVKRTTSEPLGIITLSAGVAQYRMGEPMAKLIHRADEALYAAKGAGRNRVVADEADLMGAAD